jgi:hypothetical protein
LPWAGRVTSTGEMAESGVPFERIGQASRGCGEMGGLGKAEAAIGRPVDMVSWREKWQSKTLLSYYMRCRKLMYQAQTLRVALDTSRVSRKECIMIGFMANRQCCWAPPQDLALTHM